MDNDLPTSNPPQLLKLKRFYSGVAPKELAKQQLGIDQSTLLRWESNHISNASKDKRCFLSYTEPINFIGDTSTLVTPCSQTKDVL